MSCHKLKQCHCMQGKAKIQLPNQVGAEGGIKTLRQTCYQEIPGSAMCVQNLDDSRGLAIRITYRISLRSSSLWEPRHPLLKVVIQFHALTWRRRHTLAGRLRFRSLGQLLVIMWRLTGPTALSPHRGEGAGNHIHGEEDLGSNCMVMILPQVHLRKPCYDFTFL